MTYDEATLKCFLDNQEKLFPQPVANTIEEADDFLTECMAVVCENVNEIWDFFDEEGLDLGEYTKKTIVDADEVFDIGDGRYLVVEC